MDDQKLVADARKGSHGAFKQLVDRHERQVAATVIGMMGRGSEAEDIGQETFIRFYKSLDKFRGDSSVGTYLTRIAINLCLNEIKKKKRTKQILNDHEEELKENSVISRQARNDGRQTVEENEEKTSIRETILKLKPDYRSVIVLRLMEGYSTRETADILKLPLGTVLSRLSRAQQKLKEILTRTMGAAYAG